jgi:hypothetical protein
MTRVERPRRTLQKDKRRGRYCSDGLKRFAQRREALSLQNFYSFLCFLLQFVVGMGQAFY